MFPAKASTQHWEAGAVKKQAADHHCPEENMMGAKKDSPSPSRECRSLRGSLLPSPHVSVWISSPGVTPNCLP